MSYSKMELAAAIAGSGESGADNQMVNPPEAVLSDRKIKEELAKKDGDVVIEPFNPNQLNNSSYDVTLGPQYYEEPAEVDPSKIFRPWVPESVAEYWGPLKTALEVKTADEAKKYGVEVGDRVILIAPGRTILAHTNEFIGGRGTVTTHMGARSSMGRSCISVCKCAGIGDTGFCSRYTMEIQNAGKYTVPLIVGERIAQIVFHQTGKPDHSYEVKGSYQKESPYNMAAVKAAWKPEDMLPKLKRTPKPSRVPSFKDTPPQVVAALPVPSS